jgi:hypothetical protein
MRAQLRTLKDLLQRIEKTRLVGVGQEGAA